MIMRVQTLEVELFDIERYLQTIVTLALLGLGAMGRRDSMTFTFYVPPEARGQGLSDIDSLQAINYSPMKEMLKMVSPTT